jgi:hypothetical protein
VRRRPNHAGAWIDLALIDCQQGRQEEGRAILQRVENESSPPKNIRDLIAQLAGQACARQAFPKWRAGLSLGYDSNVNLGATQDRVTLVTDAGIVDVLLAEGQRPRPDFFAETWVETAWSVWPGQVRAFVASRQYQSESDFDLTILALEGEHAWFGEAVDGVVRARWAHSLLGEENFLDAASFRAEIVGRSDWHGLRPVAEAWAGYNRYPDYPEYEAWVWEARAGVASVSRTRAARAVALVFSDRALDQRPGGNRHGIGADLSGDWMLTPRLRASAMTRVLRIRDTEDYYQPLFPLQREQTVWLGRLELAMALRRDLVWHASWTGQYSDNNLGFLDYDSNVFQTGLALAF